MGSKGKGEAERKHGDGKGSASSQLAPLLIRPIMRERFWLHTEGKKAEVEEEFFQR